MKRLIIPIILIAIIYSATNVNAQKTAPYLYGFQQAQIDKQFGVIGHSEFTVCNKPPSFWPKPDGGIGFDNCEKGYDAGMWAPISKSNQVLDTMFMKRSEPYKFGLNLGVTNNTRGYQACDKFSDVRDIKFCFNGYQDGKRT